MPEETIFVCGAGRKTKVSIDLDENFLLSSQFIREIEYVRSIPLKKEPGKIYAYLSKSGLGITADLYGIEINEKYVWPDSLSELSELEQNLRAHFQRRANALSEENLNTLLNGSIKESIFREVFKNLEISLSAKEPFHLEKDDAEMTAKLYIQISHSRILLASNKPGSETQWHANNWNDARLKYARLLFDRESRVVEKEYIRTQGEKTARIAAYQELDNYFESYFNEEADRSVSVIVAKEISAILDRLFKRIPNTAVLKAEEASLSLVIPEKSEEVETSAPSPVSIQSSLSSSFLVSYFRTPTATREKIEKLETIMVSSPARYSQKTGR